MVLEHIPDGAGFIVITGPLLNADRLAGRNLHIGDVTVVPGRLQHRIRLLQHLQLLNHPFAEIVVDPVNFLFGKSFAEPAR